MLVFGASPPSLKFLFKIDSLRRLRVGSVCLLMRYLDLLLVADASSVKGLESAVNPSEKLVVNVSILQSSA